MIFLIEGSYPDADIFDRSSHPDEQTLTEGGEIVAEVLEPVGHGAQSTRVGAGRSARLGMSARNRLPGSDSM